LLLCLMVCKTPAPRKLIREFRLAVDLVVCFVFGGKGCVKEWCKVELDPSFYLSVSSLASERTMKKALKIFGGCNGLTYYDVSLTSAKTQPQSLLTVEAPTVEGRQHFHISYNLFRSEEQRDRCLTESLKAVCSNGGDEIQGDLGGSARSVDSSAG
jgi:hypothetical protein